MQASGERDKRDSKGTVLSTAPRSPPTPQPPPTPPTPTPTPRVVRKHPAAAKEKRKKSLPVRKLLEMEREMNSDRTAARREEISEIKEEGVGGPGGGGGGGGGDGGFRRGLGQESGAQKNQAKLLSFIWELQC